MDGRQGAQMIVRKDGDELDANILSRLPGRHQEQGRIRFSGNADRVVMPHGHDAVTLEHGAKGRNERIPVEMVSGLDRIV